MALSEDQAAVYDRQLRVWGVEVQKRLNAARVMIVGGSGIAAEIAKNVVLAGVGSVVIMDDTPASAAPATNFLVPADTPRDSPVAEACVRTLQAMNPLVNVSRATGNLTALTAADLKAKCDILVMAAAGVALADVAAANSLAHAAGVRFIAAAVRGPNSYAFVDLGRHTYTPKVQTKAPAAGSTESTSGKAAADGAEAAAGAAAATAPQAPVDIDYVRFEQAMAVPAAQLKKRTHGLYGVLRAAYDFEKAAGRAPGEGDLPQLQQAAAALAAGSSGYQVSPELVESYVQDAEELAPLCAITGGVVSNTVVRALSHVDAPVCNLFLFCLQDGMGVVEDMRS